MRELLIIITVLLGFLFGLGAVVNHLESISCEAKWKHSGFESSYSFFTGCMITLPDGMTIPSENYREVP
jgi:heme/copper-type cytochrome/quinol oxidase subunit 3